MEREIYFEYMQRTSVQFLLWCSRPSPEHQETIALFLRTWKARWYCWERYTRHTKETIHTSHKGLAGIKRELIWKYILEAFLLQ